MKFTFADSILMGSITVCRGVEHLLKPDELPLSGRNISSQAVYGIFFLLKAG
jgi:hypothetical protein